MFACVLVCVQPSFVVTQVLQQVVSERDEVSSTNRKCPSAAYHLSFWSAQRQDFVKVMVPGAARSHAVSVSLIIRVCLMTIENKEAIIQMKNIIYAPFNSTSHAISFSQLENLIMIYCFSYGKPIKSLKPFICFSSVHFLLCWPREISFRFP